MELFTLQCLCTTLREGGLTPAAQAIGIRREALEQLLINLENELGVPIFLRDREPFELTEAGRRYSQRVQLMLTQLEDAGLQAASIRDDLRGEVHLGLMAVPPRLAALLSTFSNVCPRIRLYFDQYTPGGSFDLLMAADPLPFMLDRYIDLPLTREEIVVLISRECHPWATRRRCLLRELGGQTIVLPNPGYSTFDAWLRSLYIKKSPKIAAWAPNIPKTLSFVREGACTLLPYSLAACICNQNPAMRLLHFGGKTQPRRTYRILRREDKPLPAIAHRFLDYALQFYQAQP